MLIGRVRTGNRHPNQTQPARPLLLRRPRLSHSSP
jgi:hypothetical protein